MRKIPGTGHARGRVHTPHVDEQREPHPTDLAASIASADEGRRKPEPPLPKGWAGIVERDLRARRRSHPNAAGDPISLLLYPIRLYLLMTFAILLPVLVVVSLVR